MRGVRSRTFGPELMPFEVQVSHPPPHHPSPVETWYFELTLWERTSDIKYKYTTSEVERYQMRCIINSLK